MDIVQVVESGLVGLNDPDVSFHLIIKCCGVCVCVCVRARGMFVCFVCVCACVCVHVQKFSSVCGSASGIFGASESYCPVV